uniref:type II protein arginine methyltransferase n=1 Tax=Skeletonema marinoi TaxID=267567 RepID=A0A7S2Q308_9STRA|mmetsp:Transcript_8621/g.14643  ORF Transcript_8621/g.14643 Transcript_8621/m.14643 type:complete len:838 (+) Transcript_8621:105-2618(+)
MTILRAGSMVPAVAVRRRLLSTFPSAQHDPWRCITSCPSLNQYAHNNNNNCNRSRSFATSRQKRAMKQNEGPQDKKSIHGLRPNQTPSAAVTASPVPTDSTILSSSSNTNKQQKTPLILPPSTFEPIQPDLSSFSSSSNRDNNFDLAHAQPVPTIAQDDYLSEEDNALRKLLLQQGILPSPPRNSPPQQQSLQQQRRRHAPLQSPPLLPEADPSGVSHADPEDVLNMASMYDPSIHLPDKPNFNSPSNRDKYEAGTPMTDELIAYIGVRGPITVAEFMRRVLRDGRYGYYTSKGSRSGQKDGGIVTAIADDNDDDDNDWDLDDDSVNDNSHLTSNDPTQQQQHVGGEHVIGASGDFITAPEVSELFGESLLVWLITQYQTLGNPSKIQLIEIGPGKGTLICDVLRSALTTFPDFAAALTSSNGATSGEGGKKKVAVGVHLVEVTDGMRSRQKESLQKLQGETTVMEKGFSFSFDNSESEIDNVQEHDPSNDKQIEQSNAISINWHDLLSSVPTHDAETGEPIPTFIICQELLDALPIHSFQKIEGGQWRERLVDVAVRDKEEESSEVTKIKQAAGRMKYSDAESEDSITDSTSSSSSTSQEKGAKKLPRLRFVLPPDTTPALRTLLRVSGSGSPLEGNPTAEALNALPTGSVVEACPEGLLLAQDIADRIEKCNGGAALLIDYGEDGASSRDTMRGFWRHTQVHPLSRPGEVDVTADVDFAALRESVNQRIGLEESLKRKHFADTGKVPPPSTNIEQEKPINRPEAFGPVSQGQFLASMGIVQRVEKQIEADSTTDEQAYELYSALERLLAPDQMGERYKVLAIARKKEGLFPPAGF